MGKRFTIEAVFKMHDRLTAPISRIQNRMGKVTRAMQRGLRSVDRAATKVASKLRSVGKTLAGVGIAAGFAFTALAATGADFEQAITDVGAVSLQTRAQIAPLEQLALKLGATTKFTATQSAKAMEVMARAGFGLNDIMAATPAVLDAAAASGLEIAEVADHVSNALKGMGLESDQAARVADVLALASARTNSSIGSLGESLSNVTSTARQLNIPLEEVVASVALLQDVGLDASVAGSAFNTMLTKMAAPSAGITRKMKQWGISFKDAKGDMLPLAHVLEQLSAASAKAGGNFDQVAFLAELVGLRGQKAASNLADLFKSGRVGELSKELKEALGAARKMAELRMNTVHGSLTLLGSAVDAVKVKIFNMNSGPLKDTIDKLTKWVSANEDLIATRVTKFIDDIVTRLPEIVHWLKVIGKSIAVFYTFNAVLQTFIGVMTAVNLVMALNPIGVVVVSVLAAIAAFAALWKWVDDIADVFENKFGGALRIAFAPFYALVKVVQWLKHNMGSIISGAKSVGRLIGIGDDEDGNAQAAGNAAGLLGMVSPSDRVARSIEEQRTTSTSELTIKDETKRATITGGALGPGLRLESSGAF